MLAHEEKDGNTVVTPYVSRCLDGGLVLDLW
jgi:hypothetical protein